MKTIQTRFGEISYDPEKTIYFPNGLIGFESLRYYVVLPNEKDEFIWCIQSTEDPLVAFLLVDPQIFFPDYLIKPESNEYQVLGIEQDDPCFVLTTITIHQDKQISLNLVAPILYTPKTDRGYQIILEGTSYSSRTLIQS